MIGTGPVNWESDHATFGIHLREIEDTAKTTRKVGDIDIESELLI